VPRKGLAAFPHRARAVSRVAPRESDAYFATRPRGAAVAGGDGIVERLAA